MSHIATAWAFEQKGISSTAKLVLIFLADYHNHQTNLCFPSRTTLAEKCCCDEKTITRSIQELALSGLISYESRTDTSGRKTSNTYTLNITMGQDVPMVGDNLSLHEPVINNLTNTAYLSDPLLSIFENQLEEPPTVPEKAKNFWDDCIGGLLAMGMEDGNARRMVGKWLKQTKNNQAVISDAINAALEQGTQDPIPYITAVLAEKNRDHKKETDDVFAELREGHKKRIADWVAQGIITDGNNSGNGDGDDLRVLQPEPHSQQTSVSSKRRRGTRKASPARPPEIVRSNGGYLGSI